MGFRFLQIKAHTLPQGEIIAKIIKMYGEYLKIFFYRTTGPVSTKLIIKHPWVEEIQIFFFKIKSHALLQGELIANL